MSSAATNHRIRVLPPQVANQIAAGEVVERPASVVKELLENSLDAGARTINVEIEQGGVQRIRIRDDGHGIHRDDLALALSPHATSKIATAADLDGVISLGFRGEALASIASVSRLVLSSRRADDDNGWRLAADEMAITPIPLPHGTEIEVCDLFFNTPARRKFLRSERTEFSHVEEVIRRIALSHFDLAMRFSHNGKQILRLKSTVPGEEGVRRVGEVLGSAFMDNSRWLEVSAGGFRLWGWVGRGGYSRSQADANYLYLNGRMIRDRLVTHAVRLAFGERVPEGRFPAYLLYIEIDPRMVDVNVHPTKHEVRFREARQVHDFIYWAINGSLEKENTTSKEVSSAGEFHSSSSLRIDEHYRVPLRQAVGERAGHYGVRTSDAIAASSESNTLLGNAVCQLRNGYLLAERGNTTILLDLRAMLTELHHNRLTTSGGEELLVSQPLLIPESLDLGPDAVRLWRERGDALESYGFEFGWLGDSLLVLRKVPAIARAASIPSLVVTLQVWLGELEKRNEEAAREALLLLLSSHAVPGQLPRYSLSELSSLLREYETILQHNGKRPWRELHADDWQRIFENFS